MFSVLRLFSSRLGQEPHVIKMYSLLCYKRVKRFFSVLGRGAIHFVERTLSVIVIIGSRLSYPSSNPEQGILHFT